MLLCELLGILCILNFIFFCLSFLNVLIFFCFIDNILFIMILLIECVIDLIFNFLMFMLFLIVVNMFLGFLNKSNVLVFLKWGFFVILIILLIGIIFVFIFGGVVCLISFLCRLFFDIVFEIMIIWFGCIVFV